MVKGNNKFLIIIYQNFCFCVMIIMSGGGCWSSPSSWSLRTNNTLIHSHTLTDDLVWYQDYHRKMPVWLLSDSLYMNHFLVSVFSSELRVFLVQEPGAWNLKPQWRLPLCRSMLYICAAQRRCRVHYQIIEGGLEFNPPFERIAPRHWSEEWTHREEEEPDLTLNQIWTSAESLQENTAPLCWNSSPVCL